MPTTIPAAFDQFRSNLEITGLQSSTVSTRQKNVRAAIAAEMIVLDDFLTGSYIRSTMIAPLSQADIDIFVVLDAQYYSQNGHAALLDRVKRVLKKTYGSTDISRNGQAVTIAFSDFEVDVVPGFNRQGGGYLIPDSVGKRWIQTDPKKHVSIWSQRNAQQNGKLVPLIKMLKAWNRAHSRKLRSFHLEALALQVFQYLSIGEYWTAAHDFFKNAQTSFAYVSDPAGYGGNLADYLSDYIKQGEVRDRLMAAETKSLEAISLATYYGNIPAAFDKWRVIFGDYFPAYG